MTVDTLKTFRLLVPGVLLVLLLMSIVAPSGDVLRALAEPSMGEVAFGGIPVLLCGAAYLLLDGRRIIFGDFWKPVHDSIAERLTACLRRTRSVSPAETAALRDTRRLLRIFFAVIDENDTLATSKSRVYFNGLLMTSAIDITVIGLPFLAAHIAAAIVFKSLAHLLWAIVLSLLILMSTFVFRRLALKRHLELTDEQLEAIERHHANRVVVLCEKELRPLPPSR